MVKLAVFFVAAIALQGVIANSINIQQNQWQQLSKQLLEIKDRNINLLENQRIGSVEEKRYLSWQANELVLNIQDIIYDLQHAIQSREQEENLLQIQQILRRLSEISYSITQAINGEISLLRLQLRWNVENIRIEAQRLIEIIQQVPNQSRNQENILNRELRWALSGLIRSLLRLQIQSQLQLKSQEQIRSQVQSLSPNLSSAIDGVNAENAWAVQILANRALDLSEIIGNIINNLQRQLVHLNGDARSVIREVVNRLIEVRGALLQASSLRNSNQLQELRNQVRSNIAAIGEQLERLLQLQSSNQTNQLSGNLLEILRSSIIDVLAAVENIQIQIRIASQVN